MKVVSGRAFARLLEKRGWVLRRTQGSHYIYGKEGLGIRPLAEQVFRLADGSKIIRKKGCAIFRYRDAVGGADVIFGEEGDSQLLGAFTLEALGLSLDPLRRELKELPMVLGYFHGDSVGGTRV